MATTATAELKAHDTGLGFIEYNRYIGKCLICKRTVSAILDRPVLFFYERVRCPDCDKNIKCERVSGRKSEGKKCDARCLNAKRSSCECSCSGANHGAGL
jgi:hypothetical protein